MYSLLHSLHKKKKRIGSFLLHRSVYIPTLIGSCSLRILVAKSIFMLKMNTFKMKTNMVFDFATRI
jgi:hypothetical protein